MIRSISRTLGIVAVATLVLSPVLTRAHALPLKVTLLMVPVAALLGALALATGLAGLRGASPQDRRKAGLGLALGLLPVVFMANVYASSRGLPMIHDVTTDPMDPPTFVTAQTLPRDAVNSLDYEPKNGPLQQQAFPDLQPVATTETPAQAFDHAKATAAALGWEIYAADAAAGRIEAVETTRLFGFKDDVVIRIRPRDTGCRIDLRSVSRVGGGDMGANAARIRRFVAAYAAK